MLAYSLVIQAKANADLVPAAEKGDLATVQDCLSKKANIETDVVRCMFTRIFVTIIRFNMRVIFVFVVREHIKGYRWVGGYLLR
jgi:hypothetical protein